MFGNEMPGNISIQKFIASIERHPIIWDVFDENYKNKAAKMQTWDTILEAFVPNYRTMSAAERKSILNKYLRKWKSFRNCYTREKSLQKKETQQGFKTDRKIYAFYNDLKFLDTRGHALTPKPDDPIVQPKKETAITKPADGDANDEKVTVDILSEFDGDKLFLLSLFEDLHKLPDSMKQNVKEQMLGVVTSAQQACLSILGTFSQQSEDDFMTSSGEAVIDMKAEPSDFEMSNCDSLSGDDLVI